MTIFLTILAILVCLLLGLIVLVQNPKGGGLASNFSSSSQLMGVQKTGDFLEKGTWVLAITLMVLCLAINVMVKTGSASMTDQQRINSEANKRSVPATTTAPAQTLPSATPPADSSKK